MSRVYERIVLSPSDSVTLRVPLYTLTFDNIRCMDAGEKDTVALILDKRTGKVKFGPMVQCG